MVTLEEIYGRPLTDDDLRGETAVACGERQGDIEYTLKEIMESLFDENGKMHQGAGLLVVKSLRGISETLLAVRDAVKAMRKK